MAKVYYVMCPACKKEYYIDQILYEAILANPKQKLVCPFCKKEFHQKIKPES
jgi:ribosomal protein L37AE/L43A